MSLDELVRIGITISHYLRFFQKFINQPRNADAKKTTERDGDTKDLVGNADSDDLMAAAFRVILRCLSAGHEAPSPDSGLEGRKKKAVSPIRVHLQNLFPDNGRFG